MLLYMKALGRLVLKFAISVTMLLASVALSAAAQDAPDRNFLNQNLLNRNLLNRNLLNKDSMLMADNVCETPAAPTVTIASASVPALPPITAALLPAAPIPVMPMPPVEFMPAAAEGFVILKKQPPVHKFFDVRNSLGLTAMASSLIADAVSTQKGLAYPGFHEMNPIARPFVQSRAGAAAYSAGSFALLSGIAYTAHKTGHHKLEQI